MRMLSLSVGCVLRFEMDAFYDFRWRRSAKGCGGGRANTHLLNGGGLDANTHAIIVLRRDQGSASFMCGHRSFCLSMTINHTEVLMRSLAEEIPDIQVLLALAPEELAYTVLRLGSVNDQNGLFHPASFEAQPNGPRYPQERATQAAVALGEALAWLTVNILVMPAPGINGNNGHLMITCRGRSRTMTLWRRFCLLTCLMPKSSGSLLIRFPISPGSCRSVAPALAAQTPALLSSPVRHS
jgi:hypothetical protein